MIAVGLAIVLSIAAGAWAEHRWREAARRAGGHALDFLIYALLPLVTFFTVGRVELTTAGVGRASLSVRRANRRDRAGLPDGDPGAGSRGRARER